MASRRDVYGSSGKHIVWRVDQIRRGSTLLNLSAAGTQLRLAVKRSRADDDAAAIVVLDNAGAGGLQIDVADTNLVNVNVPPAATADFDRSELLEWELTLVESSTREEVVAYGTLKVRLSVSPAPA